MSYGNSACYYVDIIPDYWFDKQEENFQVSVKNDIVFCTDILGTMNEVRNRDIDTQILTNFATADTKI